MTDLLKPGYQKCNAAEIMIQICEVLSGRIAGGHYDKIINEVKEEWLALKKWPSRRNSARYEVFDLENGTQNPQLERLGCDNITDYLKRMTRIKHIWFSRANFSCQRENVLYSRT